MDYGTTTVQPAHVKLQDYGTTTVQPAHVKLQDCADRLWADSTNDPCVNYQYGEPFTTLGAWCTPSGGYGPGWQKSWGAFADWTKGGHDATTACCACGGGLRPQASDKKKRVAAPVESVPVESVDERADRAELEALAQRATRPAVKSLLEQEIQKLQERIEERKEALAETAARPDAVSATGDPHLSNIRGEHFDIYQPGNMTLIHVPRHSEPARTLLLVEADAQRMGDACLVYFQGVTISGLWTNQSKPIQFLASPRDTPEGRTWKEWRQFGSIDLKVVRRTKGVDYLDIYLRNVGRTSYEVGGLLGLDDHSTVAQMPRQCAHRHAAMLVSSVADAS